MSTPTMDPRLPQTPGPRRHAKPLTLILVVLGGLILLGLVLSASLSAFGSLSRTSSVLHANAEGLTALDIEANDGKLRVQFADITEAQLDVRSSRGNWDFKRQGSVLVVDAPDGWETWCFFGCDRQPSQVVLTLPEALNNGSLDVQLELAAGEFLADGAFNNLNLDMSAGRLVANGSAHHLNVRLGAGYAALDLAEVGTTVLDVAAGRLDGQFTGSAPSSVHAEISAGMLDLTLPDAGYDVRSEVAAGNVDNRLSQQTDSAHKVSLEVSAGTAVLRRGQ